MDATTRRRVDAPADVESRPLQARVVEMNLALFALALAGRGVVARLGQDKDVAYRAAPNGSFAQ